MNNFEISINQNRERALRILEQFMEKYNNDIWESYISYFDLEKAIDDNYTIVVKLRDPLPADMVLPIEYKGLSVRVS